MYQEKYICIMKKIYVSWKNIYVSEKYMCIMKNYKYQEKYNTYMLFTS